MRPAAMQIAADLGTARNPAAARAAPENRSRPLARRFRRTTVRFVATVLTLLCVLSLLSPLAGCARLMQPGVLPSDQERCANAGGSWSASGALCRYPGQ